MNEDLEITTLDNDGAVSTYNKLMELKTAARPYKESITVTILPAIYSLQGVDVGNVKIGASSEGRKVLSGLSDEEEKALLPDIISTSITDPSWYSKVENYWASMQVPIPNEGLGLEVGMSYRTEEEKKKGINGFPINVRDYIIYRYCQVYKRCAIAKEDVNPGFHFMYIDNPHYAIKKTIKESQIRDEAMVLYLELKKDTVAKKHILYLFDKDADGNLGDAYFSSIATSSNIETVKKFIETCKDESMKDKVMVKKAVEVGLIKITEDTGIYYYENVSLGYDLEEAVRTLKAEKNNNIYSMIKNHLVNNNKVNKVVSKPSLKK